MDVHTCREGCTKTSDVSVEDTINHGHVQSNLNREPLEVKFHFKEDRELHKEESEDSTPVPNLVPKAEPIQTTARYQADCGGEPHELQKSVSSTLVIIKTEPEPEEYSPSIHSSGEQLTLQHSEDKSNLDASLPKETCEYEFEVETQHTLEDGCSLLVVIKMEPDDGEPISSGEHATKLECGEVSTLPALWKTEPDDTSVPYSAHDTDDPQLQLGIHSVQNADDEESSDQNQELNGSGDPSHLPSSTIGLGKELGRPKCYSCTECGSTFSKSSSFYRHMRIHTGERPYQCSQCNKTFIHSTTLKVHQRIHTGEKPYQCSDCGKTFRRLDNLQIHQRTHTGEKPYKCSHCPKTFTRLDVLQIHQRIHTGEKPYQCSRCCKSFTRLSVFQVHQRIHTGERPYQCSTCKKHFVDASNLKNHERTHTLERPYQCSECERTFIQLAHLMSHQRKHTGEKPYHCSICGKSYTTSSTLLYHKRKHTPT